MSRLIHRLLAAVLGVSLATGASAGNANRAVTCDGCSDQRMTQAAAGATDAGTVYVFNGRRGEVRKYDVFTEVIDHQPYTVWTQAVPVRVENTIRRGFEDFLEARAVIRAESELELPEDFPVRSVAGSLLDPARTTTYIEDWIDTLDTWSRYQLTFDNLVAQLAGRNIPFVDVRKLLDNLLVTIVFPDGSRQDFYVDFSVNALSFEVGAELESRGNARLANGDPAPTSASSFIGEEFEDEGGSLNEWAEWARALGAVIIGSPGNGTKMSCTISGNNIHCRVVGSS
jgi:hypothetical protein